MNKFRIKEEWIENNKSFSTLLLLADLVGLFLFEFIKNKTNDIESGLPISIILLIVFGVLLFSMFLLTIIYIVVFSVKSKTVDINKMFPEIQQCSVFLNVGDLSFSTKEDILKWYNIVEYDEIERIETQLNPDLIEGNEHIWLVTSDLWLELNDKDLISTIQNNILKGIKYTYFLPDNDTINLEIEKLNNIYGIDKIKIIKLNKQCKLLFNLFDVIIFDPINDYSNAFICVDFTNPRNYRKLTVDDARNLITKLNNIRANCIIGG